MTETVVGLLGLLCIVAIVVTLFQSKTLPSIAFIVFPFILAMILVLGGYISLDGVESMIKTGFNSTAPTAALFVFSVLYFGIMTDAGMFDVIIGKLMKLVGNSVIGVTVMTTVIALIGHLDGGGASTFCIVVPSMLPVYKKMHMRPTTLLRVSVLAMGVLTTSFDASGAVISAKSMDIPADATLSVVRCLANIIRDILPAFLGTHLALVIGVLSVPLALAFDTDSYFYGMLPVMIAIGQGFGVQALPIAVAMVVCRNCATFISPMVPATLLGTGLADVDIKDHIKCSFGYVWGFSILCMIFAIIVGIMPL